MSHTLEQRSSQGIDRVGKVGQLTWVRFPSPALPSRQAETTSANSRQVTLENRGAFGSIHCWRHNEARLSVLGAIPLKARIFLAVLVLTLQGCASVPLSTMVRMSSFSARDFSGLSVDDVGVKIRIPRGFGLDVANSWLGIEVTSKAGIHNARFELDQVKSQIVTLPGGFLSGAAPGMEYELGLASSSAGAFRDLQELVSQGKAEDINIRVVPKLSSSPEGATSIAVWIDLRLSESEGYFPLVDGSSIPLAQRNYAQDRFGA